jgi:hypothetical protein
MTAITRLSDESLRVAIVTYQPSLFLVMMAVLGLKPLEFGEKK